MPVYIRPDGSYTPYPTDRAVARSKKSMRYDSCETCSVCRDCTLRFVANDACVHCSRLAALDFFNSCHSDPKNPADAVDAGLDWFVTDAMCEKRGHVGVWTLNNQCVKCAQISAGRKSLARVEARRAGSMWYTPERPCDACGRQRPRRVNNNSCRGCEERANKGGSEADALMLNKPDVVIGRVDAKSLGLRVYRTGTPCHRGHTAFRYVSTGGCIECKKTR